MIGSNDKEYNVSAISSMNGNITVAISHDTYEGRKSSLYTLYAANGVIVNSQTAIQGTSEIKILDIFSNYQGTTMLIKTYGQISSDRIYGFKPLALWEDYYAVVQVTAEGEIIAILYYPYNFMRPIISMKMTFLPNKFPNFFLMSGDSKEAMIYSNQENFLEFNTQGGPCKYYLNGTYTCLICNNEYYLGGSRCTSWCPSGYKDNPSYCIFDDKDCSGSSCGKCFYSSQIDEISCSCDNSNHKYSKGYCTPNCREGYIFTYNKTCVKKCPDGTIKYSNFSKTDNSSLSINYLLQFNTTKRGLNVSIDKFAPKTFPNDWTISFWIKPHILKGTLNLLNAFNYIKLKRESTYDGKKAYISLHLGGMNITPSVNLINGADVLTKEEWTYVTVSKGVSLESIYEEFAIINMAIIPKENDIAALLYNSSAYSNMRPDNLTNMLVIGGDMNDDGIISSVYSFEGYLMEFKFFAQYMSLENLKAHKFLSHNLDKSNLLFYWRLIAENEGTQLFQDEVSNFYQMYLDNNSPTVVITNEKPFNLSNVVNENFCKDFPYWRLYLPPILGSSKTYTYLINEILQSYNEANDGDVLYATNESCHIGYMYSFIRKELTPSRNYTSTEVFNNLVPGVNYRLCYKTQNTLAIHMLTWIYVAKPPERMVPEIITLSNIFPQDRYFTVVGGDESFETIFYVSKSVDYLSSCSYYWDSCITTKPKSSNNGMYNPYFQTPGVYYLFWRPYYAESYNDFVKIDHALFITNFNNPVRFRIFYSYFYSN